MARQIDVLVLRPDGVVVQSIDGDDYRELRRLVGGNLGSFVLPPTLRGLGFYAYCDDDAMIRSDPPAPNPFAMYLGQARLRGPVVILRADETGTEHGLSDDDIAHWVAYLNGPPAAEAFQMSVESEAWWEAHPSGFFAEEMSTEEFFKRLGIE